jgi:defect-in-organelle-trafficking protein DotD
MNKRTRTGLAAALLLALPACQATTGGTSPVTSRDPVASTRPIETRLGESAERIADGIRRLASVQAARSTPNAANPPASIASADLPRELQQELAVSWSGPVEGFAKSIAQQIGYEFRTIGRRPATALVVKVEYERRAVVDLLRDAALQTGNRAEMVVDPNEKLVELRYAAQ